MTRQKTESRRYPVDVTTLNKGDRVISNVLERFLSHPEGSKELAFAMLDLCQWIMAEREAIGQPVTACVKDGAVVILTDEQAAEYNNRYFFHGFRRMFRGLKRQLDVDVRHLAEDTHRKHMRRIEVNSRTAQGAMLGRRNKLQLTPTDRKTPLLLQE